MEQQKLGLIIMLAVGIIVALAILPSIANQQAIMTQPFTIAGESHSVVAGQAANGQINMSAAGSNFTLSDTNHQGNVTGVSVTNGSGVSLTEKTDFFVTYPTTFTNGVITIGLANTSKTQNLTTALVTYTIHKVGYSEDAGGRGLAGLLTLLVVIGLIAFGFIGFKHWFGKK